MYQNEQHKCNQRSEDMDFVNIFACSHLSQLCVFVRFENCSLPRIWKASNLFFFSTFRQNVQEVKYYK